MALGKEISFEDYLMKDKDFVKAMEGKETKWWYFYWRVFETLEYLVCAQSQQDP
jgi:hypothetical protein